MIGADDGHGDPAEDDGEQHRNVPQRHELGGGEGSAAGEDDLGQPQHPALSGHHREGEEGDGVAHAPATRPSQYGEPWKIRGTTATAASGRNESAGPDTAGGRVIGQRDQERRILVGRTDGLIQRATGLRLVGDRSQLGAGR